MIKKLSSFPSEKQLDKMDCGPACLKILAKYYGKFYRLQYLKEICCLTKKGVTLLDLSYGAEAIGFRTLSINASIDDLVRKIPLPGIIHWADNHFVVVYKAGLKRIYISDPAIGLLSFTQDEFKKKWYKAGKKKGVFLVTEPLPDFEHYKAQENPKHKTLTSIIGYLKPYKRSVVNLLIVMFIVTALQAFLPFIAKAVIDVGIQTRDLNFINIVLIANVVILLTHVTQKRLSNIQF